LLIHSSLKRKESSKTKKISNNPNSGKASSSDSSSSSDDEHEGEKIQAIEPDIVETIIDNNQTIEESTLPSIQQQEKINVRQHLRNRHASSSDEEEKQKSSS
jgi:hypothetical protein